MSLKLIFTNNNIFLSCIYHNQTSDNCVKTENSLMALEGLERHALYKFRSTTFDHFKGFCTYTHEQISKVEKQNALHYHTTSSLPRRCNRKKILHCKNYRKQNNFSAKHLTNKRRFLGSFQKQPFVYLSLSFL